MAARVFLLHGWSATDTSSYQALHLQLAHHGYASQNIFLGRYISLDDTIDLYDLSAALDQALRPLLNNNEPFHLLCHSTGALIASDWLLRYYQPDKQAAQLRNLVMLAAPNFGSRLAHHSRSMMAHMQVNGDSGRRILDNLELGSAFNWQQSDLWLQQSNWRTKGVRVFCLAGDRIIKSKGDPFAPRLFHAGFEAGSDMVVRCASANLNFNRYQLSGDNNLLQRMAGVDQIPYQVFRDHCHSGPEHGIINSIKRQTTANKHPALAHILSCLAVDNPRSYQTIFDQSKQRTDHCRQQRPAYSQLLLRLRDQQQRPIDDAVIKLGWYDDNKNEQPSRAVRHVHQNRQQQNHYSLYLHRPSLNPQRRYYLEISASAPSDLYRYQPQPLRIEEHGPTALIDQLFVADQTTQLDIILNRQPIDDVFHFHDGNDVDLHLEWDRTGTIRKRQIKPR